MLAKSLVKIAVMKANHLPPRINLSVSDLKNVNTMAIDKRARRWENSKSHKYKELVPAICKNSSKHTF